MIAWCATPRLSSPSYPDDDDRDWKTGDVLHGKLERRWFAG